MFLRRQEHKAFQWEELQGNKEIKEGTRGVGELCVLMPRY